MKKLTFLLTCTIFCLFSEEEISDVKTTTSTTHLVELDGKKLSYIATAGQLDWRDSNGNIAAHIFYTAYTKDGENLHQRPITFCFNGGPGCSSMWLHLGFLGPRKVKTDEEGKKALFPPQLQDNESTLLDVTDLVFVDPVGTGFSQIEKDVNTSWLYSLNGDIKECADFIRDYLTKYSRWLSPKYLIGESYGTARVAGLSECLQQSYGINLNGVVLISLAIDLQQIFKSKTQKYSHYTTMPYIAHLPSYASVAYYHKKISQDKSFEDVIKEAKEFAENEYSVALLKGERLTKTEFDYIADKVAKYSSLPLDLIKRYKLKIPSDVFLIELLKDENLRVGLYDGRIVGYSHGEQDDMFFSSSPDPSTYLVDNELTACINSYLTEELKYSSDFPYIVLNKEAHGLWNFSSLLDSYANLSSNLETAMITNPAFKLFIANGYYDLVTPFAASQFTVDHLNVPASYRKKISVKNYAGGHMMYLNPKVLKELKADLRKFYEN